MKKTFAFGGVRTEWLANIVDAERLQEMGTILTPPLVALLTATTYTDVTDAARFRAAERGVAIEVAAFLRAQRISVLFLTTAMDVDFETARAKAAVSVTRELRNVAFMKIISLAPEVL